MEALYEKEREECEMELWVPGLSMQQAPLLSIRQLVWEAQLECLLSVEP